MRAQPQTLAAAGGFVSTGCFSEYSENGGFFVS
jgi:hypothetical protein